MRVRARSALMLGAVILVIAALRHFMRAAGLRMAARAGPDDAGAREAGQAMAFWPPHLVAVDGDTNAGCARIVRLYYSSLCLLLGATGLRAAATRI